MDRFSLLLIAMLLLVSPLSVESTEDDTIIENEYLILCNEETYDSELSALIERYDIIVKEKLDMDRYYIHLKAPEEVAAELFKHDVLIEQNRRVINLSPQEVGHRTSVRTEHMKKPPLVDSSCVEQPTDGINMTWGLIRSSYRSTPDFKQDGYRYSNTGDGVDIYVLDSGIEIEHKEFSGRATHGFVSTELLFEGPKDMNGHGTNVAGLAGGNVYGIAKGANLISVKVLGEYNSGSWAGITEGVVYVVNRVRREKSGGKHPRAIINMSLGGSWPSQILYQSITEAVEEGVIVITAAGNEGEDARYAYPAGFDNTLSVGATDIDDNLVSWSNYGRTVDVLAPGRWTYAAWVTNSSWCEGEPEYECITWSSGTSMSTPLVAGVVARYLQGVSDIDLEYTDQATVRAMLEETASVGYIKYLNENATETPNRLLFRDCKSSSGNVYSSGNKQKVVSIFINNSDKSSVNIKTEGAVFSGAGRKHKGLIFHICVAFLLLRMK